MCIATRSISGLCPTRSGSLTRLIHLIDGLAADRRGIESLEWAVLAAIVVVGAAATYSVIFPGLGLFFNSFGAALNTLTVSL